MKSKLKHDFKKKIKLGLIITSYNNLSLLKNCLDSVYSNNCNLTTFVIDNNSTDGTKDWLSKKIDLEYTLLTQNLGPSYAFNLGIKQALKSGCSHVITSDEDVYFNTDYFTNLNDFITASDADYFTTKVLGFNSESLNPSNLTTIQNDRIKFATWIGSCFSYKCFDVVGYPYKNLFRFHDDTEFTYRLYNSHSLVGVHYKNSVCHHKAVALSLRDYFKNPSDQRHANYYIRNHFFLQKKTTNILYSFFNLLFHCLYYRKSYGQDYKHLLLFFYYGISGIFHIGRE